MKNLCIGDYIPSLILTYLLTGRFLSVFHSKWVGVHSAVSQSDGISPFGSVTSQINIIYDLQFGFRQQNSTSHALINITENIRKTLDDGNIGCGVFVDLQKAFDTVDHQILLAKLNHYGIRGVSNDWFKSNLSNRNQYVSVNEYEFYLAVINCGVPQGSVLGPLLFLLYINDLHQAITFCKVHHSADDTNLLCHSNSIKKLNKVDNADLKHLVNWLNANKISPNVKKLKW